MIAGFGYGKRTVWIDTDTNSKRVFCSNPESYMDIQEGFIEDIFKEKENVFIKTDKEKLKLKLLDEPPYLELLNA